ncbi:alcohol dehydrogenase [Nocardia sp. FDAARGOS_372]|nr:alcohol dehydrogenase [Nocardia sp. FDAARGOS_372]
MRAWVIRAKREPLELVNFPEPALRPGEVILDVLAAGLCHSDVGIVDDDAFPLPASPFVLGHEIAGTVAAVGPGVTEWAIGDAVCVGPPSDDCPGIDRHGGYAEKVSVPARMLIRIPDELPFELAAVAMDAGMTSHAAVMTGAQAGPGRRIGIIGFGGLGQFGTRIASLAGAQVYVAELKRDRWPAARAAGAVEVGESIVEFADRDLDAIVDFAGFGTTTSEAIRAVRRHGRVVQVGLGVSTAEISMLDLTLGRVTLIGVMGGERQDAERVCALMAAGRLDADIELIGFGDIAAGVERLRRGQVAGRLVATLASRQN